MNKALGLTAYILLIVGSLNWGLVGAFNFDLVQFIFGSIPVVANIVYILVGISAIIGIFDIAMKKSM